MIDSAIILAAGLGKRMRPLTDHTPKPLVPVAGKSIIDHTLMRLTAFGTKQVVVNCHYLAEQIEDWAQPHRNPRIMISNEREHLLDSGGGVKKALSLLPGTEAFFVANGDSFWVDGAAPALSRMAQLWNPSIMDCLLLVCGAHQATGYEGLGDFIMSPDGHLERRIENQVAPFVFAGCYISTADYFRDAPEGAFSVNQLWNRSLEQGRLYGLRHDGMWLHVGTPQAIAEVEAAIEDG